MDPEEFQRKFENAETNNNKVNIESDDGNYTFLQYCCDQGHDHTVKFLLEKGADPNGFSQNYQVPPIVLAAHHGYYKVLDVFLNWSKKNNSIIPVNLCAQDTIKEENVLHKLLKRDSKAYTNAAYRDYDRCLEMILDNEDVDVSRKIQPAINAQDQLGNSPLHIAAQLGRMGAVRQLLRREANIGLKNFRKETPISYIPPAVMEEYLDECLQGDGITTEDQFRVTFKYSFLGPPMSKERDGDETLLETKDDEVDEENLKENHRCQKISVSELPEAEPLWYMAQLPDHRRLLLHPVITSFLCLKWRRIRPYYYINLISYLFFVGCLTSYLVLMNMDLQEAKKEKLESIEFRESIAKPTLVLLHISLILLLILTVRELFQALVSFRRYIFNRENVMELAMVGLSYYLLCGGDHLTHNLSMTRNISAAAILLSWAEMMLMFGRHPKLSTFIAMLSTVSYNFMLFLTWYISIIIAFGLAFFVMLNRTGNQPEETCPADEPPNQYYESPKKSLLKTIVMSLTGEIEFEGIDFADNDFTKIIFLFYIFFVFLVLINLLNGLAVSDIGIIQTESEIVSYTSRVELITFTESMLLGDPFQFLSNTPTFALGQKLPRCDCMQTLYRRKLIRRILNFLIGPTLLFTGRLANKRAVFYPNKSYKERSLPGPDGQKEKKTSLQLDPSIMESAKSLIVKRQETDCLSDLQSRMKQIEKGLFLITKQQNYIIEKLNG